MQEIFCPLLTIIIVFFLFNILFTTVSAVTPISTLGDPLDAKFRKHEAASGVSQTAEAFARITLEMLVLAPLPVIFACPLISFTNLSIGFGDLVLLYMATIWCFSSLGYIFSLLVGSAATVLTTAFTLILVALLNGTFGLPYRQLPDLIRISPGYSCTILLAWGTAITMPFAPGRIVLERALAEAGIVPKDVNGLLSWETGTYDWKSQPYINLLLWGLIGRVIAVILFYVFNNYDFSGGRRMLRVEIARRTRRAFRGCRRCLQRPCRSNVYTDVRESSHSRSSPKVRASQVFNAGGVTKPAPPADSYSPDERQNTSTTQPS